VEPHSCNTMNAVTSSGTRRAWILVGLLWIAYFINYLDRQAVFSLFPILRAELGFTDTQLGMIGSIFLAAYSLSCPLTGWLADRLHAHLLVPLSMILWSLATLATGLCHSVPNLLFWRGVMGLTEGMYFPAALSVIGRLHGGRTRSRAIALHGTAQFGGSVAGGWFGGFIGDAGVWRWGFAAVSLLGILYAALLRGGLRALPERTGDASIQAGARSVVCSKCFLALNLLFFVLCGILWVLYAWLPSLIHDRYGLTLADSGFTATAWLQISSAIGILAGGAVGDWISRHIAAGRFYIVAAGMLVCSPLAWEIVATHSLNTLKVAAAGFGIAAGFAMSNVVASVYDVVSSAQYGFAAGFLTMIGGAAGAVSMVCVGQWKAVLGVESIMGAVAVAGILSALLLAIVAGSKFRIERQHMHIMLETVRE
jgi:MFS family permease